MPLRTKAGGSSFSTNITTAARQSQKATRAALGELNPAQRRGLSPTGPARGLKTAPILKSNTPFAGLSTFPKITFAVRPSGRETGGVRQVARHEVAHLLGAGHAAIRGTQAGRSGTGLRQAPRLEVMGLGAKFARANRRRVSETVSRKAPRGFSTPHLRSVASTGSSEQRKRVKSQMLKLGQKARKLGVDF